MIVTCERCATQFQLDDSRIPPEGVRVRCSRCKHAFHIELPLSEAERIQRAAAQAAQGEASEQSSPDSTQDLPIGSAVGPSVEGGALTDDVLEDEESEESDWEFNDDRSRAAGADVLETGGDGPLLDSDMDTGSEAPDAPESPFDASAVFDFAGEDSDAEGPIALEGEDRAAPAPLEAAPETEAPAAEEGIDVSSVKPPKVGDLGEFLTQFDSADDVKALKANDSRKTAQAHYDARLLELSGGAGEQEEGDDA